MHVLGGYGSSNGLSPEVAKMASLTTSSYNGLLCYSISYLLVTWINFPVFFYTLLELDIELSVLNGFMLTNLCSSAHHCLQVLHKICKGRRLADYLAHLCLHWFLLQIATNTAAVEYWRTLVYSGSLQLHHIVYDLYCVSLSTDNTMCEQVDVSDFI